MTFSFDHMTAYLKIQIKVNKTNICLQLLVIMSIKRYLEIVGDARRKAGRKVVVRCL